MLRNFNNNFKKNTGCLLQKANLEIRRSIKSTCETTQGDGILVGILIELMGSEVQNTMKDLIRMYLISDKGARVV